jgi:hypothetical protein
MKPETYKLWEEALNHFRNAEELLKNGNSQEAVGEANLSVIFFGFHAILELSKELEMPDLSVYAWNVVQDWCERSKKHHIPEKIIEWARKTLKRLYDECPPDTFPPLR